MNIKSKRNDTKVITGKVRFSYVSVFKPSELSGKYSVSLLIPKADELTINNIKEAIREANEIGRNQLFKDKNGKARKVENIFAILHDGDKKKADDPVYEGCYYINASCKTKPGIVDKYKKAINDTTEFYSGCYGLASINFYPYNASGTLGIACGLNNLMKLEDGEALGGRASAQDDFKDFGEELDEFDEDNFEDDLI